MDHVWPDTADRWIGLIGKAAGLLVSGAPSDHTQILDLCALHYVRKVYKNNTVGGRVLDIPGRANANRSTYAGTTVVVKHLLSGDYRVFHQEELIAWVQGERPKGKTLAGPRSLAGYEKRQRQKHERNERRNTNQDGEGDMFT